MNPTTNEGLQLPPPVSTERAPSDQAAESGGQALAEAAPGGAEQNLGAAQAAVAAVPAMTLPGQASAPVAGTNDVSSTSQTGMPAYADDADLIEKEWVNKAKQIVERTRDDPYQQNEQLTAVKADYMQKRYNKTIKLEK